MVAHQLSEGSAGATPPTASSSASTPASSSASSLKTLKGTNGDAVSARVLTMETTNPCVFAFKQLENLAVGPVILKAMEMERELEAVKQAGGTPKFEEIIKMNLGDAHAMGQKPISYVRQVLSLVSCPELMELSGFNEDVKRKAREILGSCRGGSAGSYSDSRGIMMIRKHVAKYIQERDGGHPAKPEDVILTAGASEGIRACLRLLKSPEPDYTSGSSSTTSGFKKSGVLIPVPEYPIYSVTLDEYNMKKVPYYLEEHLTGWEVNVKELEGIVEEARKHCEPRAVVVINPGNPTGHLLTRDNMECIIKFAYKHRLVIFADEVYQDNVYGGKEFTSFKKVMSEMEAPFNSVEMISFHSCSKGFIAECGLRAGYFEVANLDPEVKSVLAASVVANLCPTVLGQTALDCLMDPPKPEDPSYGEFIKEKSTILGSLAERAELVYKGFNSIPGMSCARLDGAMYAFPQIHLPPKALSVAEEKGLGPDVFYCMELLQSTGICCVPGSSMGQKPGSFHLRTTILAPTEKMKRMLERFKEFHMDFVKKYGE